MAKRPVPKPALQRPPSVSRFWFNLLTLPLALAWLAWRQTVSPETPHDNGITAGLLIIVLIGAHELLWLRVHRNPSTGLDWDRPASPQLKRVAIKLLGLILTLALIGGAYALFPEYHGSFYDPYWSALKTYGLPMLALAPFYFWWLDGRLKQPQDGYWHLASLLWMRSTQESRQLIGAHLSGWAVKAFFLPLMTVYMGQEVRGAANAWQALPSGGYAVFEVLFHLTFTVDLLFCIIGYAMTLRLVDAHIRWTEPTAFGWLIALVCYQPFFSLIENMYLRYEDGIQWGAWLAPFPVIKFIWAAVLVALLAIYALSTVAFGLRFSNLTARGIITDGPYRYSKHPAYLSKNLSWWMISIPFIATAPDAALMNCAHLLIINAIYFLRARTEEAHLSRDPDYLRYAEWMREHGLLARLGRSLGIVRR